MVTLHASNSGPSDYGAKISIHHKIKLLFEKYLRSEGGGGAGWSDHHIWTSRFSTLDSVAVRSASLKNSKELGRCSCSEELQWIWARADFRCVLFCACTNSSTVMHIQVMRLYL